MRLRQIKKCKNQFFKEINANDKSKLSSFRLDNSLIHLISLKCVRGHMNLDRAIQKKIKMLSSD